MRVALVHDWLTNFAGSERCIHALHELYPEAPVFTSVYNEKEMPEFFKKIDIKTSFIQKLPFAKKNHQIYYSLMPVAFESFDFSGYDIVISSSHACSKGVITNPETLHLSYIYTPTRYLWSHFHDYKNKGKFLGLKKFSMPFLSSYIRLWDRIASERPDYIACDSKFVAERIEKYYRRKAEVIYPPVDISKYSITTNPSCDYYLMVGRLVPYKRFDLAINAFNNLGLPLKIAGTGSEYSNLKKISKSNIEFLGYLSDSEISKLYSNCTAFVFPGEEDFGISPLEAQASGRPVIAYGKGGALETVKEYETGIFFREPTVLALEETIKSFQRREFIPEKIRKNAVKFDISVFKKEFSDFVSRNYRLFNSDY